MSAIGPGCVKTLRGITVPGILGSTVTRRAKKCKNLSSARHYDQIRFRFHTAKTHSGLIQNATYVRLTWDVQFSRLFFSIDLYQRQVAKIDMTALRWRAPGRALKLLGTRLEG